MLKVVLYEMPNQEDGKIFFCDSVKVYESGGSKFIQLHHKGAKVKSSLLPCDKINLICIMED